mmetsp:Transcript_127856/g.368202  ORF Transcript_127856/g.368202 Transcript_127856/m.368202 type:complete len:545 (-) Transcript_127856:138-1772(-)
MPEDGGVWGDDAAGDPGGPPPRQHSPDGDDADASAPVPKEDSARKLSFARCGLRDRQVLALSFTESSYGYHEVDFSMNEMSSAGARIVMELCLKCPSLRVLKLFKNRLDDGAVPDLSELFEKSTSLREVHLSHNAFTADGITMMVQAATRSQRGANAALWLRVENNKLPKHEQPGLLEDMERRFRVCPRKPECSQFTCHYGSKVHLPFLNMERERAEHREAAERNGLRLRSRSCERPERSPRDGSFGGPTPRLRPRSLSRSRPGGSRRGGGHGNDRFRHRSKSRDGGRARDRDRDRGGDRGYDKRDRAREPDSGSNEVVLRATANMPRRRSQTLHRRSGGGVVVVGGVAVVDDGAHRDRSRRQQRRGEEEAAERRRAERHAAMRSARAAPDRRSRSRQRRDGEEQRGSRGAGDPHSERAGGERRRRHVHVHVRRRGRGESDTAATQAKDERGRAPAPSGTHPAPAAAPVRPPGVFGVFGKPSARPSAPPLAAARAGGSSCSSYSYSPSPPRGNPAPAPWTAPGAALPANDELKSRLARLLGKAP